MNRLSIRIGSFLGRETGMRPHAGRGRAGAGRAGQLALAGSLLITAVSPWIAYLVIRPHVRSATEALAIGGAIPVAWALVRLAAARKVAWLAVTSTAVFAVLLVASLLSGGSALPLKLHSSVITGAAGLACVISVMVGRPLPVVLTRRSALRDPDLARRIGQAVSEPSRRRKLTVVTGATGVIVLLDATVHAVLAVTLTTATFLAVSKVASWGIIGAGCALLVGYLRHGRSRPLRRTASAGQEHDQSQ